jgi:uncharacterized membrane protein YkvA (DUF1232 family)
MGSIAMKKWKQWAIRLKVEVYALYLAYKDPRVPRHARILAALVVGYAFSPIDLIPDPIPILGYLDDLVLIPLGVALALKMIPAEVMADCREKAKGVISQGKPVNRTAAVVIVGLAVPSGALRLFHGPFPVGREHKALGADLELPQSYSISYIVSMRSLEQD